MQIYFTSNIQKSMQNMTSFHAIQKNSLWQMWQTTLFLQLGQVPKGTAYNLALGCFARIHWTISQLPNLNLKHTATLFIEFLNTENEIEENQ